MTDIIDVVHIKLIKKDELNQAPYAEAPKSFVNADF